MGTGFLCFDIKLIFSQKHFILLLLNMITSFLTDTFKDGDLPKIDTKDSNITAPTK